MRRIAALLLLGLAALGLSAQPALSQATVLQAGPWLPGHTPGYAIGGGSQPVVVDSGAAGGGGAGVGLSELNITARGTGTPPFVGQGTGPSGTVSCIQDAPTTNATGGHQLCLSANALGGGGLLYFGAFGTASSIPFSMNINGQTVQFPFVLTGIVGPSTTVVDQSVCWNNTSGTLVKTCIGSTPLTIGGTNGQIQWNNAGALGGFTASGDAAINTGTGAVTVSKIGGVSVVPGGTLTTAAAFTTVGGAITLTTSAGSSVTVPATGTLATLAGSEALTNKTVNGLTITPSTGTLGIGNGKVLTSSNTLTFAGTDGSTLNIGTGGTLGTAAFTAASAYVPAGTQITNSMSGNVTLSSTSAYFDGPSVAQGSVGTWFASGNVTISTPGGGCNFNVKLWDGTTVIDSSFVTANSGEIKPVHVSGYLATPGGNIRISVEPVGRTDALMVFNASGNSKDGSITAFRIQ